MLQYIVEPAAYMKLRTVTPDLTEDTHSGHQSLLTVSRLSLMAAWPSRTLFDLTTPTVSPHTTLHIFKHPYSREF
jgi:hypothetical protein